MSVVNATELHMLNVYNGKFYEYFTTTKNMSVSWLFSVLALLSQVFPGNQTTVSNSKPIVSSFSNFSGKRLFPNIFNKCVGTAPLWLRLAGLASPALLRTNHVARPGRGILE